jgi:4-hydroxy 2-oxovalerate aldolase
MKLKILDCTLRDGAHVNNGYFGATVTKNILQSLIDSKIDMIEVGFLESCSYEEGRAFFPTVGHCESVLEGIDPGVSELCLMARPDRYDIKTLEPCTGKIKTLRFAFYGQDIFDTIKCVEIAKGLGYKVYLNPINVTNYSLDEFKEVLVLCAKSGVNGVSVVDTFGSLSAASFREYVSVMADVLSPNQEIGLHLHENLSSSFPFVQDTVADKSLNNDIIIDASLHGIGRIPGNLPVELVAAYLNRDFNKNYGIFDLLTSIERDVLPIKSKRNWGYSPEYMLSGIYDVHRSYPEFFVEHNGVSMGECSLLISQIVKDKMGTEFDKPYAKAMLEKFRLSPK